MHKRSRARVHDPRAVPLPMVPGEDTRFTPSQPLSRPANARRGYPAGSTRPLSGPLGRDSRLRGFQRGSIRGFRRSGYVSRCVHRTEEFSGPCESLRVPRRRLQVTSKTRYSLTACDFVFPPRRKRKHFTGSKGRSFAIKRVLSAKMSRRDIPGEETAQITLIPLPPP